MKRLCFSLILIALSFLFLRKLYVALASDEKQIRWLVARMEDAYDEGRAGGCVADVHREWRHEGADAHVDRALLEAGLRGRFFQNRSKEGRELLLKVDVDQDALEIEVVEDTATLACEARFYEQVKEEWVLTWHTAVEAELVKEDGRWLIKHTRARTLEGRGS